MNRISFLLLLFICKEIKSQSYFIGWDTVKGNYRINISPLQFAGGPWRQHISSNLPEESSFILSKINNSYFGYNIDMQVIFKDKVGFDIGYDFLQGQFNEKVIRNDFQNHVPNYTTTIPQSDYAKGNHPFRGTYRYGLMKIGLVGFLPLKKIHILPYFDYLFNKKSSYPTIKVEFSDILTTTVFTREYQFYNTSCNGLKLGAGIRGYFKNPNAKINHTNLFMQLRIEFVYLKTKGYGYYIDKDINKNEIRSESHDFNKNIYAFAVGFTLGGLDIHW